ncbi:3-oxoacyl-[acyl-carrier-protein] synthase III C-terminal domain-containing protein [Secundilactobacillus kimchicus]|uniref:3-oxoacyl-[acyl-carrier-protein] synthase III C-terminal domain-containing protein n=1 Tax=Secundilactobacillus kimchicus TaxID=528209 RepID=UPI002437075D|nr:3-oxoacyl-[acyl-carrier-protein] synthase III C-terminal domain-containing protein [Secundilactobacillus kimchicus]
MPESFNNSAKKLGLTAQQCPINIDEYGNVAAASEPLVLNDLVASGQLKPGDKVLLCGFGGGLTIGASIFDYYN